MNKIVNGKTAIYWGLYYLNGQLMSKVNFKGGRKVDYWEHYYFNSKLTSKGIYKNGKEIGCWEYFYEDGTPSYQVFFF